MKAELAGRLLDQAVAQAMGWQIFPYQLQEALMDGCDLTFCPPGAEVHISTARPCPRFSGKDYSGFKGVELWLSNNAPTPEECGLRACVPEAWASLRFSWAAGWRAEYILRDSVISAVGLSLTEAACRLVLARREMMDKEKP